jgi:hypothetical protein
MPGLLRLPLVTPSREKTTRRSRLPGQANRLDDPGRNAGRHGRVGHRSGNNSFRRDARAIADIDVEAHGKGIDPDIAHDAPCHWLHRSSRPAGRDNSRRCGPCNAPSSDRGVRG